MTLIVIALVLRRDHRARRYIRFDPRFQCQSNILAQIAPRLAVRAEVVCTSTSKAMLHSRHHVQTDKGIGRALVHRLDHFLIVVDRVQGWNSWIVPSVVRDQLATTLVERR